MALCYGSRLRQHLPELNPESKVVVIVCGGSSVSLDLLAEYRKTYGTAREVVGSMAADGQADAVPSQVTAPRVESR